MDQNSKIVALQAQIVQRDQEIAKRDRMIADLDQQCEILRTTDSDNEEITALEARLKRAVEAYRALKTKYVAAMAPFERVARRTRTKSEVFNDQLKVEFMKRQAAGEKIVITNGQIVSAWNATH